MSLLAVAFLLAVDAAPVAASPSPSPSPAPSKSAAPSKASPRPAGAASPAPGASAAARKPPAKVLTNDDLEKTRDGAAVSVLKAEGLESEEMSLAPAGQSATEMAEANWRGRADAARARIAQANGLVASIEARITQLREDRNSPEDPMGANRLQSREAEIAAENEKLASAQEGVAAARQAFADLEEEARKESVPPGWLRER
jgi:hypothetical protein